MPDDFLALITSGVESDGNPLAKNPKSSASGAYQMLDKTWQSLGNPGSARDAPPEVQAAQAHKLRLMNDSVLQQAGIPINPQTQYLAWAQGAGGAKALIKNPDKTAVQALIDAGVPPRQASAQVLQNGGTVDMRAGDFAQRIVSNLNRAGGKSMASADTGSAGGLDGLAPFLQQVMASQAPDATETSLLKQAQDRTQKSIAERDASSEHYRQIGQQMAAEHSPNPINAADFTPPNKQQIEKDELAKVSNDPGNSHRVMSQFLPVLAIFAGSFAKNNAFAGMKAATAAMNAAKANDQAAVEKAHTEFTDAMTELKTRMDTAKTVYDENRNKYGDDMAGFAAQQSIQEAIDGNDLAAHALATGQWEKYFQFKHSGLGAFEKLLPVINSAQNHQAELDFKKWAFTQNNPPPPDLSSPDARKATIAKLSSDPGIVLAAQRYLQTGVMPNLGMGASAKRGQVLELAGLLAQDQPGGAAAAPGDQAAFHADSQALSALAKTRAQVEQFEGTAQREADLTMELAAKGEGGKLPVLNRWIQAGRVATGDPDVTAFNTALTSFKNEYARIMSTGGTGGGGMTSDSARGEAETLINKSQSPVQLKKNIETMKRSMANRRAALDEAYKSARDKLSHESDGGGPDAAPAAKALPSDLPSPKGHAEGSTAKDDSGNVVATIKNGQWVLP